LASIALMAACGESKGEQRTERLEAAANEPALEILSGGSLNVNGMEVSVGGERSASETRIDVTAPAGFVTVAEPFLVQDGERVYPYRVEGTPDGYRARFPATSLGEELTFDLGPVALMSDDATALTIAIGQALDRAPDGADTRGEFAISLEDVIAGDAGLIISAEHKQANSPRSYIDVRDNISVLLRGAWAPRWKELVVFDELGNPMRLGTLT
jgi:hypothetical protein